jgi:uncharacterized protein YndB with AHSA1/START domain
MSETTTNLGEVTYVRTYEAPADLIFECLTNPEHLTNFWGPPGTSAPLADITVDLRVGGAFESVIVDDASGDRFASKGTFVEIDRPSRLVWREDNGMTTAVTFTELGDGRTEVVTHQTDIPPMFNTPEAQSGMQASFDRFAAYLAGL